MSLYNSSGSILDIINHHSVRTRLKRKVVALAVMERARKRQNSRITNLKEGDANTRFFHLRVNHRRWKNFIHRVKHNNGWVVDHDHKKSVIQNHFAEVSKRGPPRHQDINWDNIPVPARDLSDLGAAFTEEEVRKAVFDLPRDKAPGPDGFSGAFFKECWGEALAAYAVR